ncbi:MAG: hypothetical protein FJ100_12660 [Deltaproteobacteria bacterium]|nr:hypothetical protein [Deltaproteobacteria bacterium]
MAAPQAQPTAAGYDYGTFNFLNPDQFLPPQHGGQAYTFVHEYKASTTANQQVRVVLVWNSTPMCWDPDSCATTEAIVPDLDLHVTNQATGQFVATSTSYDSNYEVVQFTASANEVYLIRFVWLVGGSHSWYAVAWAPNAI